MSKTKRPKTKQASPDTAILFDTAVGASLRHDDDVSIAALQEVIRLDPKHARGHYLLGAEYAQTGDVEAALREMATAIQLDPTLVLARFQLGTLLLTINRVEDAIKVWSPLDALGETNVLNQFRVGMLQMLAGQYDGAKQMLEAALANTNTLPALQHDIQVALDVMRETIAAKADEAATPTQAAEAAEPTPNSAEPVAADTPQPTEAAERTEEKEEQDTEDEDSQHVLLNVYHQSHTLH